MSRANTRDNPLPPVGGEGAAPPRPRDTREQRVLALLSRRRGIRADRRIDYRLDRLDTVVGEANRQRNDLPPDATAYVLEMLDEQAARRATREERK